MDYISLLIVDDDLVKISSIIQVIKEQYFGTLSISQASNVQEAIEVLSKKEIHLLITDLQMPLKYDDIPRDEGGVALLKNIYRNKYKINVPMYIVCLTQYIELKNSYQGVWKVWYFDKSLEDWKKSLRDLIFHISLVKSRILSDKIETLFVEGPTDKKSIEAAMNLFYQNYAARIYIDTIQYGGGASWVERQLFIWAKSLSKKNNNENYIKAVGLFDDDISGNESISRLRKVIDVNSAESMTFSVIKYAAKYSPLLKSIKNKGISFPTTLEELIAIDYWKIAESKKWLNKRDYSFIEIDNEKIVLSKSELSEENLISLNFTEDEIFIIQNKIKDDNKTNFCNLVCSLNESDRRHALTSIGYLLRDVFERLKIDITAL